MADKGISLDIVIVNYNSTDHLLRCLESVYTCLREIPAEVVIQDNCSTDNADRVVSMFPTVALFKNSYNMGFAKAVNQGLRQGASPYVVLLNPDSYVMQGFFASMIRYLNQNPSVGVVGPKVLNEDGSVQGSARSFLSPLTALFGRSSLLTRWFPENPISKRNILTDRFDGVTPMEVDWVSGACMVVRRKAIVDVGLLDERFFLFWEDADWCKRMWEAGWKVVYYPQAIVKHLVGGSSQRSHFRSTVEFHKSAYRLFAKHAKGAQRFAIPLAMGALAVRLLLSLSWYAMHHWSGRIYRQSRPKNTLRI